MMRLRGALFVTFSLLVAALPIACGSTSTSGPNEEAGLEAGQDSTGGEVGEDAPSEVALDSSVDGGDATVGSESGPDAAGEGGPDVVAESGADAPADGGADVVGDVFATDVMGDTARDSPTDASGQDVTTEGASDSSTTDGTDAEADAPPLTGTLIWDEGFGMTGGTSATAVAVDPAGNVFVTGDFTGTVNFGTGPLTSAGGLDIFVAKFTSSGAAVWAKRFGDACDNQDGTAIATDSTGNVIVTGGFKCTVDFGGGALTSAGLQDIFVAKFDGSGAYIWANRYGDAQNQSGEGLAVDSSGNILTDGEYFGTADFGLGSLSPATNWSAYLAKLSSSGTAAWSLGFTGPPDAGADYVEAFQLAVDSSGDPVFTGYFGGTVNFGLGPLTSAGQNDVFVAKFSGTGTPMWANRYGDPQYQVAYSLALDASANVYLVGDFNGSIDFGLGPMSAAGNGDIFFAKLDASGNGVWSKHYGDATSNNIYLEQTVTVDSLGNPTIAGGIVGNADFGGGLLSGGTSDPFPYIAGLTAAGTYAWSFGGDNQGSVQALCHNASGELILAGAANFQGVMPILHLAGGTFTRSPDAGVADQINAILAKLSP
jgi:hypothetical protein